MQLVTQCSLTVTSRTVILLVTRNREEGAYRTQLKRMSHNEAEKKRIKTINKCVDDIRELLDVVTSFENESVGRESAAQIGQGIHAGSGRDIHQESDERTRSPHDNVGMWEPAVVMTIRHRHEEPVGAPVCIP